MTTTSTIRLRSLSGDHEGETFTFNKDAIVLGRGASCDLTIDDAKCSRVHALIERVGSKHRIRDLGSQNGLTVNGEKIHEMELRPGDRVELGGCQLLFDSEVIGGDSTSPAESDSAIIAETLDVEAADVDLARELDEAATLFHRGIPNVPHEKLAELERSQRKMAFLYRASKKLNGTLDREELLEIVSGCILEEFQDADRVSVFLSDRQDPARLEEARCTSRCGRKRPVSRSVLKRVLEDRVAVVSGNALADGRFERSVSIRARKLRSFMCMPLLVGPELLGAIYVENTKKVEAYGKADLEVLTVFGNQAAAAIGNVLQHERAQLSYYQTVRSLGNALDAKDRYTRGHSERVAAYAVGIGRQLELEDEEIRVLQVAAELHDIGKIAIGEHIIGKDGELTEEEYAAIRRHPDLGVEILRPIDSLQPALPLIRHHHERFDGSGYPSSLRGEEIPLGARIISLADAFDAMVTQRAYNSPLSPIEALQRCHEEAGTSFDPDCVEALVRHLDDGENPEVTTLMPLVATTTA